MDRSNLNRFSRSPRVYDLYIARMDGWLSLILRLLVGKLVSENKERGSKTKESDHGTRHDCAHKEEEGAMITSRALGRS